MQRKDLMQGYRTGSDEDRKQRLGEDGRFGLVSEAHKEIGAV